MMLVPAYSIIHAAGPTPQLCHAAEVVLLLCKTLTTVMYKVGVLQILAML